MTPVVATLLSDCARHLRATEALFATLPAERRAAHLAQRARELVGRIEDVLQTETSEDAA